ncbi:phosphotransferase [Nocardioides sp.]|uniref:maltokinase N-terminal cap-like domain-containing protein n=1 Tax=Nocardioides sp. TaxID=35761 RepID=UPI00351628C0
MTAAVIDPALLAAYLPRTRWFGGKGRDADVVGATVLARLAADPAPVLLVLAVDVAYADAGEPERYQVPLACYPAPQPRLEHALIGPVRPHSGTGGGDWHAYDAAHDPAALALWWRSFADLAPGEVGTAGGLRVHRVAGPALDPGAVGSLFSGEQSNSSVFFDDTAVLKLFRKLTPGEHPDVELHRVLTEADSPHVAQLWGWLEVDGTCLGMLQEFLRTATDGWDLACASVRDLMGGDAEDPAEAGGDFGPEAARLGEAVRAVHDLLGASAASGGPTPAEAAADMRARLDDALRLVPDLAEHAPRLRALYDRLAALPDVPGLHPQRVHGDLHLGQTLRTADGWRLVDFEGEPARPAAQRRRPDSPWRDVAGMLRSFDYVPAAVAGVHGAGPGAGTGSITGPSGSGVAWAQRSQHHFLTAYAGGELDEQEQTVVEAYLADKAVYETVYETRNRPDWVAIPLASLARIGA